MSQAASLIVATPDSRLTRIDEDRVLLTIDNRASVPRPLLLFALYSFSPVPLRVAARLGVSARASTRLSKPDMSPIKPVSKERYDLAAAAYILLKLICHQLVRHLERRTGRTRRHLERRTRRRTGRVRLGHRTRAMQLCDSTTMRIRFEDAAKAEGEHRRIDWLQSGGTGGASGTGGTSRSVFSTYRTCCRCGQASGGGARISARHDARRDEAQRLTVSTGSAEDDSYNRALPLGLELGECVGGERRAMYHRCILEDDEPLRRPRCCEKDLGRSNSGN